ncbi:MAG: dipeptidase, partial [Solobacterium sp.]|nr:dipeptidase [Solobacterium sp.]
LTPSTENFYWASRIIECLADSCYGKAIQTIERYQQMTSAKCHELIGTYDKKMTESNDFSLCEEANEAIAAAIRKETEQVLGTLILTASANMKNGYSRADN